MVALLLEEGRKSLPWNQIFFVRLVWASTVLMFPSPPGKKLKITLMTGATCSHSFSIAVISVIG